MSADMDEHRFQLVRAKADQWAKSLIELGPRNTLLNFKNTKTTSLDLTNADSAALQNLLHGKPVKLSSLFQDSQAHKEARTRARNVRRAMHTLAEEQGIEVGKLAQGLVRATPRDGTSSAVGKLRAPLLLRTLRINARTVADSEFELELSEDAEPNPVLLYALDKDFGLELDVQEFATRAANLLSDTDDPLAQPDAVQAELAALAQAQGVSVELEPAVVCGLFNYEKQPMVEDLSNAGELLAGHDLVAALAEHEPAKQAITERSRNVDVPASDAIKPADEFLVQDADSSQQEAVSVALSGHDVLVEGPPGTGKSQTIANIIAGAAARGMRVLFVSEKRAAIEAVTTRLAEVELDGLVFDLHQQKMDKKHIARQLHDSLEAAGRQPRPDVGDTHRKVEQRRSHLRRYSDELHQRREPWGKSAYEVQAELLELRAPATPLNFRGGVLRALDAATVERLEDDLRKFVGSEGPRVVRRETPWWKAEIWDEEDLEDVYFKLTSLASDTLRSGQQEMARVLRKTGLRPPQTFTGWQQVLDLLDEVNESVKHFGGNVFGNRLDDWFHATTPAREHLRGGQRNGWLARRRLRNEVKQASTEGITERAVLHAKLAKVVEQRDRWQKLGDRDGKPSEVVDLQDTMKLFRRLRTELTTVALCANLSDVNNRPPEEVGEEIRQLQQDEHMLWKMQEINHLLADFERLGLTPLVQHVSEQRLNSEQAWQLFRHVWLKSLLDRFKLDSPVLREFSPDNHTRLMRDYRENDTGHLASAADRVRYEVARRLRQVRDEHPDETRLLREQANKRSRHLPLRRLVEKAPQVLLALRPCWAMSPLVVSRTLPAKELFDLVVFDEASQIRPHDAVATIARGKRLVVAGDDKQLPPSNQFERILEGTDDEDDNALHDYESILTTMRSVLSKQVRLRWHYRSTDERLIAFSNQEIYNSDLVTFPGTAKETPVVLHMVEDGTVAPGQRGSSPAEVQVVVDLVLAHAEQSPEESLGVIAMGNNHADKVEAAVRRRVQDRPDLQEFFSEDSGPGRRFFVKNLERVQGDERDAIILTLGVAKRSGGRLDGRSFGPLNSEGGRRRLNVAVTRAKNQMTVVSAVSPAEIEPSQEPTGTELLRRYLEFAQAQGDLDRVGNRKPVQLNGFEQDVHDALVDRGIEVHPQWGVSGYCIDFALAHRDRPGQMVLAVEADGDRYHRMTSVRDRDRLRQSHLERLGWQFHRLWASAWFVDRTGETDKIVKAWEDAMREADREVPPPEPPRAAEPDRTSPESRRGPRPDVPVGLKTDEYTEADLIATCRWLLGDGLQLDREQRLSQALHELGFKRRGRKIAERLSRAIDIAQDQADKEDS